MKILFFILSFVLSATHAFAVQEEVLFSCKGGKTTTGVVPIYKVESLRNANWISTVEAEGVISETGNAYEKVKISGQEKKTNGCVVTLEQKINGQSRKLNLIYEDKELFLTDKAATNFAKAPCRVISKNLRAQLNNCQIIDQEKVSQGMLCRSANVDDTEIHLRIDTNKDTSYTERHVFQVYKGKAFELGTRTAEITSSLVSKGEECVLTVTESKETDNKRLRMVLHLKKPFSGDVALGQVEYSQITTKNASGQSETISLPDKFKNMKCEFMGDLAAKVATCEVDTIAAQEAAAPPEAKQSTAKPASSKPATSQKAAQ